MNFRNRVGADHQTAVPTLLQQLLVMDASPAVQGRGVFGSSSHALRLRSSEKSERLGVMEANCLRVAFCF